jgi:hypothetical protein
MGESILRRQETLFFEAALHLGFGIFGISNLRYQGPLGKGDKSIDSFRTLLKNVTAPSEREEG